MTPAVAAVVVVVCTGVIGTEREWPGVIFGADHHVDLGRGCPAGGGGWFHVCLWEGGARRCHPGQGQRVTAAERPLSPPRHAGK